MNDFSAFRPVLNTAFEKALSYIESLDKAPVNARVDDVTLRQRLARPLEEQPLDASRVIEDLVRDVDGGLLGSSGGRFFSWAIGGSLPGALAADWLTSAWDQNAALYVCSPAAAIVEEVVGHWLKDVLAIPDSASFALVTGCQMAHVTCLAAARHSLLARCGWDIERRGLFGAPPIRIISSTNRHGSIDRAVRLLGLGAEHIDYLVPTKDDTIGSQELRHALQQCVNDPTIVLLEAGNLNTGVFDSFESLIPIAKEFGAWVHVDGAFGLWAAASPRYRHLTAGAEFADSWATDGHKWLNVPYDCGYAFVADPETHRATMSVRAPYITSSSTARDQIDWNPEWSRRARAFPTYAAMRELGRTGIADLVDRSCDFARELVESIGRLDGAEILWHPVLNQGLIRFKVADARASEGAHDERTAEVIRCVVQDGNAFFGSTVWRDKMAMRVSVLNWQTSLADVARAVASVEVALKHCSQDRSKA